jgi:hypothetical protein
VGEHLFLERSGSAEPARSTGCLFLAPQADGQGREVGMPGSPLPSDHSLSPARSRSPASRGATFFDSVGVAYGSQASSRRGCFGRRDKERECAQGRIDGACEGYGTRVHVGRSPRRRPQRWHGPVYGIIVKVRQQLADTKPPNVPVGYSRRMKNCP